MTTNNCSIYTRCLSGGPCALACGLGGWGHEKLQLQRKGAARIAKRPAGRRGGMSGQLDDLSFFPALLSCLVRSCLADDDCGHSDT